MIEANRCIAVRVKSVISGQANIRRLQTGAIGLPALVLGGVLIATVLVLTLVLRTPESDSAGSLDLPAQQYHLQPGRREFIESLIRKGYFERVELSGESPQVWVTPAFRLIDSDQREAYLSVVHAYHATAHGRRSSVSLIDVLTGEELGQYDPAAGGLRLH